MSAIRDAYTRAVMHRDDVARVLPVLRAMGTPWADRAGNGIEAMLYLLGEGCPVPLDDPAEGVPCKLVRL